MKRILLVPLLLLSGISQATEDGDLANAVNARLAQKQAEVWQIDDAIYKLGNSQLTDTQKYQQIAEPGFIETQQIVSSYGFTLKQLYAFEATFSAALDAWLQQHPDQAGQLQALEEEIMLLQQQLDQLIQADSE